MSSSLSFDTSYETFHESVIQASFTRLILVDIWADWCAPCLVLAPVLDLALKDYGGTIALAKLDVDQGENMKIAGRYKVRGFPTVIAFFQGEEKARFHGAKSKTEVRSFIESLMSDINRNR
ncbi:MAG: thioredoxin domain-containing protein [Gammaproteobacteria bacterium]|jgi:putative thioredoxin